ncbi:unnamed protein product, partial [Laminaria digitata]
MLTNDQTARLLNHLCVELGFCLPPEKVSELRHRPPPTPTEFVDEVFTAEGLDPQSADRRLYRTVRAAVLLAFEASD